MENKSTSQPFIEKRPAAQEQIGLYLHVPFCQEKCGYCDFYSLVCTEEWIELYTKSLIRSITTNPYGKRAVDTLYFGGGTPTLLSLKQMARVLQAIDQEFSLASDTEITVEANPEGVDETLLQGLQSLGINRMSFGIQSAVDRELEALDRLHTAQQAKEVVQLAGRYFSHLSADMMLGIPFQTPDSLQTTLDFFAQLPLNHISGYLLSLEETVPLYGSPLMKQAADEEQMADLYLQMVKGVEALGFSQYEISNFAKPGGQSRHNLKYWRSQPYLGIGPSAHSFLDGKRFSFSPSLADFVESPTPFSQIHQEEEGGGWEEYLMLRLRLREGVSIASTQQKFPPWKGEAFYQKALSLASTGLVGVLGDRVALTTEGFLVSNRLTADLLYPFSAF